MSKQSEARIAQEYVPKYTPSICSNCLHFSSERVFVNKDWTGKDWFKETNMRCGIGGFAVKKMGTCMQWSAATAGGEQK